MSVFAGLVRTPVPLAAALIFVANPGLAQDGDEQVFEDSRIFIEYNSTDNDLGFHVLLDGEDWKTLEIIRPDGRTIFHVRGRVGYRLLGLTELFFEGAEPSLADVPLDDLLALFPEGTYEFEGVTVEGDEIEGEATLSHAVPAGPEVDAMVDGNVVSITWNQVTEKATDPAGGIFPDLPIDVVAYQVIVGSFQVTLPATEPPAPMSVTVPPEFVASLEAGEHGFEVLAIDASGNQTITAGSFTK